MYTRLNKKQPQITEIAFADNNKIAVARSDDVDITVKVGRSNFDE